MNLLDRKFGETSAPNGAWIADIAYISTGGGRLYLAALQDLHACEIVGWAMDESLHHYRFTTREHARQVVFEYIEVFYNHVRRHAKSVIKYLPISLSSFMTENNKLPHNSYDLPILLNQTPLTRYSDAVWQGIRYLPRNRSH